MKYWAYLNDEVSQQPYTEDELKQLQGFGADMLICSETSAVSADPDWRPVKELLPHLIRPKAPNFAKFRPKPPVPAAPSQPVQQQEMPQETLPIPNILPAGINAMPMAQGQNVQMPVQNQPQQASAQNDISRELLSQLESLTSKINSLENKIVEQEKELAEAYKAQEDFFNPPTLISEPQNEQEDDVLEIPFENDFEMPFEAGKSSEEIAKEAEAILSNPTPAEIEEYNTDDQKTELMTFGSDIQNILEDTIRQDLKAKEEKVEKKADDKEDKPIIAEDLISRTTLSFPANDETEEKEEDIVEEEPSDELNIDNLDELLEQKEQTSEEEKQEETPVEEKPAEEPQATEEKVEEQPAEEVKENVEEEKQEEAPVEDAPAEDTPAEEIQPIEEKVEEQPAEEVKENVEEEKQEEEAPVEDAPAEEPEEYTIEEQIIDDDKQEENLVTEEPIETEEETPVEQQEEKPEVSEEDQHTVSLEDAEELTVKEDKEETPAEETPAEEPQATEEKVEEQPAEEVKENVEEEKQEETPVEETPAEEVHAEEPESAEEENKEEEPMTMGVSISKDETTAAVMDEIAQEKSHYTETETTPEKLFDELEHTAQQQAEEGENLNVDAVIEETKNQPMPQINQEAPVAEENQEELSQDLPKEDEFLKTFTTSVEEVFLDQPTAIISDYVPPSDDTQRESTKLSDTTTNTTMMETIRREKPSDIKTVPLVSGTMGQEIWSSPYVESATAELRKKSKIADIFKFSLLVVVVILFLIIALSGFAVVGIVPEKFSPLHRMIYSLQKSPAEEVVEEEEDMEPEMAEDNNIAAAPVEAENEPAAEAEPMSQEDIIISNIKAYGFKDGTNLESRILAAHPNLNGDIEWALYPTEEDNVYSIAVKLPPNNAGQSFSYRFNYNTVDQTLTPTTSEAKNIMEK